MSIEKTILNVEGMSCEHCVKAVKTAVGEMTGVENVTVDLQNKKVTVDYNSDEVTVDEIKETIEDQGYDVV